MEPTWLATAASQFLGFHSEKLRLQFVRVKTSDWNDHWTILFCVCVCVCVFWIFLNGYWAVPYSLPSLPSLQIFL